MTSFNSAFAARNARPASAKFLNIGDRAHGVITKTEMVHKRDFDTRELVFDDDGLPVEEPVITLAYNYAQSHMTLYVGSWRMLDAISKACAEAGVESPEIGGTLTVEFTGYEKAKKGSGKAKTYAATYEAAARSQREPSLFDEE